MGQIWFTSDLHFGHRKVSEIRGFESTEEHDALLSSKWRGKVTQNDTIFVLGDVAASNFEYALGVIRSLPGEKHLIAGNHDPVHPMHGSARRSLPKWHEVFSTVQPFGHVKLNKRKVLLSHFPYSVDRGEIRYPQWRLRDEGALLLHGHTHSRERSTSDRELHVGVDAWGFAPVSLGAVAKWVEQIPY